MGLFDNTLKSNESLFIDENVLDFNYLPKIMKYREDQQKYVAECIKPLFSDRSGKNLLISGKPGIGKTSAVRFVLRELEEKDDDISCIYVNCWKENTSFKVISSICEQVNYNWTQTRNINELLKECSKKIEKTVIVLDEIDKLNEKDILYSLLESIKNKCIFLITNDLNFLALLDNRIRSRLLAETINFKEYNLNETEGILKQRIELAFVNNVWDKNAFNEVVKKCHALKDIRSGLFLIKDAGNLAESSGSKKILIEHCKKSIEKLSTFKLRNSLDFSDDKLTILNLIKENSGKKCIELFKLYQTNGGDKSYQTFKRNVFDLEKSKVISIKNDIEGIIVKYGILE